MAVTYCWFFMPILRTDGSNHDLTPNKLQRSLLSFLSTPHQNIQILIQKSSRYPIGNALSLMILSEALQGLVAAPHNYTLVFLPAAGDQLLGVIELLQQTKPPRQFVCLPGQPR